jgi:polyisoprenoid-binding protein YceI
MPHTLSLSGGAALLRPRRRWLRLSLALALAAAATAAATGAQAQAGTVQVLPQRSEISFTTRQMGVPVEGRFTRFAAQVTLDPKQPEAGSVAFSIDTGSARFGSAELDAEVPKPIWLAAARFPQATFQSSAVRAAGPGRFKVAGRLSIKGSTQDITVPVQVVPAGNGHTASGSFTLRRLDFRIGEGEWTDTSLLANDVVVRFRLALAGLPAL